MNDEIKNDICNLVNGISCDNIASVYKGIHIKTTKNGLPTY